MARSKSPLIEGSKKNAPSSFSMSVTQPVRGARLSERHRQDRCPGRKNALVWENIHIASVQVNLNVVVRNMAWQEFDAQVSVDGEFDLFCN